jgi:DNA-3-methyladenine glycosylase II
MMKTATAAPHTFELDLEGPLDIAASVERFRRWGDDLLDRWDGQTLVRTAHIRGEAVPYACAITGTIERPRVVVTVAGPAHQADVALAIRSTFVTPPPEALARVCAADPVIASLATTFPGIRPLAQTDGLTALIRSISAQQVNLTWATTTRRRLAEAFGQRHTLGPHAVYSLPVPQLAAASVAALRQLQFTTRKAEYIVHLAQCVHDGSLDLDALASLPDDEVIQRLAGVRGIGRWTAEWYLARTLGRPVVVAGDLGVRKAVGTAYLGGAMPSEEQVRALTAHWGAAASVAQELLLYALNLAIDFASLR